MSDLVLAFNAGSSTVKFALFAIEGERPEPRFRALIEDLGSAPRMTAWNAQGNVIDQRTWPVGAKAAPEDFAADILDWIDHHLDGGRLTACAHRVAHGGPDFAQPIILSEAVLGQLELLCPLAPLHQPHNLAMARAVMRLRPGARAVAGFDTAFFHTLPAAAQCVPLPPPWPSQGVRRYGFHGLSYSYLQRRLQALDPEGRPRRVIFAHLGSGASVCGCLDGAPIETTMGFSPLDGLVMSTRCGRLDPGVILHLLRAGLGADDIEDLLYRRSGLLAVSGLSGDMRTLLASSDEHARAAVDLFVERLVQEIGGLVAGLGGLDALVFSAGIGEHSAEIRRRVCERLRWLGVEFDETANGDGSVRISTGPSAVSAWVIATDEELVLAEGAAAVLRRA